MSYQICITATAECDIVSALDVSVVREAHTPTGTICRMVC